MDRLFRPEPKVDLKKRYKPLFSPKPAPGVVDVPRLRYLMIEGRGAPETLEFEGAVQALYSTAYTVKFSLKRAGRQDFVVPPLEGLWHADDPSAFTEDCRDEWQWVLMLMQPEHVNAGDLAEALEALSRKGKRIDSHSRLQIQPLDEGRAVQCLHVGPYSDEGPSIRALHKCAAEQGYSLAGVHHEIYLSDPRRTAPEKLKTILRQPVARSD